MFLIHASYGETHEKTIVATVCGKTVDRSKNVFDRDLSYDVPTFTSVAVQEIKLYHIYVLCEDCLNSSALQLALLAHIKIG